MGPNPHFQPAGLRKVSVFVGAYGSGKSEVSVNYALWLAGRGHRVRLADLDTINPFYRSADAEKRLTASGIRLIKPVFANTNVDVPAIGGEVYALFDDRESHAVLDIGGEDLGARIVASLRPRFTAEETALYMVVNLNRPFTSTPEAVASMAETLAKATGLPLSGLVDNTNLLSIQDPEMLEASARTVRKSSETTGIPLVFRSALDAHVPQGWNGSLPDGTPLLRMERTIGYSFT